MIDCHKPMINLKFRERDKTKTYLSNLLKLRINPAFKIINVYTIFFPKNVEDNNTLLKTEIIRNIHRGLKEKFTTFITAGPNLFSPTDILKEEMNFQSNLSNSDIQYQVVIKKSDAKIDLENLRFSDKFSIQVKQFVEILIKNILQANDLMRMGGRTYFDRESYDELVVCNLSKSLLNKGTFLYSGYSIGVNLTEKGIFLKVSIKNKIINQRTCLEKIVELKNNKEIEQYFTGASVLANYGNYKYYVIERVSFVDNVENVMIHCRKSNKLINLLTYYNQTYQVNITDRKQPLFVSLVKTKLGEKESIFLVPELLLKTGIDEHMKGDENFKKDLMNKTKMTPSQRIAKINEIKNFICKKGLDRKKINKKTGQEYKLPDPDEIRKDWGLEIGKNMQVNARVLTKPEIQVSDGKCELKNGKIDLRKRLYNPLRFSQGSWLLFYNQNSMNDSQKLISNMQVCSKSFGIVVEQPICHQHRCRSETDILNEFTKILNLSDYKIVVVIISCREKLFYKAIKNALATKYGIVSQVVQKEKFSKGLSYFSNVLLQMNSKLCGELFHLNIHTNISSKGMIVGLDCSKRTNKAIREYTAAASYDLGCTKYYTTSETENSNSNISPICPLITSCVKNYFYQRRELPTYIYIYRSGVSEKERRYIKDLELQTLIRFFSTESKNIFRDYSPKICFIIVNKTSDFKFFDPENPDCIKNPEGGSIIDSDVCNPSNYDFYLQPQYVNSGCASPTHYDVIYDSTNIPMEILESCTYYLCYYYWNWSGAIRIPAPLKFAEVCSKFSNTNLHDQVLEKLRSTPYYL